IRVPLVTGVQTCALPIYFERVHPAGCHLEERIVQCGVASREPRDDELPDLLTDREAGEQRVDGNRRDGGRGTRNGFGCSSDRVKIGRASCRERAWIEVEA